MSAMSWSEVGETRKVGGHWGPSRGQCDVDADGAKTCN